MGYQTDSYSAFNYFNDGQGIVTLCGSTKFFGECMEINRRLTFQGWLVLMCGSWGHSYHQNCPTDDHDFELVKKLHFVKILQSDAIIVVSDKSLYTGTSTQAEVNFSLSRQIPIFYFDGEYLTGNTNKVPPRRFAFENSVIDTWAASNHLGF